MKKILLIAIVALLAGCENPFSPRGPYTPRLVVYSVLSNIRGTQFVRVSATSDPSGVVTQLPDSGIAGADVRIVTPDSVFVFRDTVLQLDQTGESIHAYVCDSMAVTHGTSYRLQVQSGSLTGQSSISAPTAPSMVIPGTTAQSLDHPIGFGFVPGGHMLRFTPRLSANTRSCLIRMYIEFQTRVGPDTISHRWEVPMFVSDTSFSDPLYPGFVYADRSSFDIQYSEDAYAITLAKIVFKYSILVKFTYVMFEVYQIGEPLQNYSSVVNGFQDELSIRSDTPDYSNISGGLGLFGVDTRDEIRRPFPKDFYYDPAPAH